MLAGASRTMAPPPPSTWTTHRRITRAAWTHSLRAPLPRRCIWPRRIRPPIPRQKSAHTGAIHPRQSRLKSATPRQLPNQQGQDGGVEQKNPRKVRERTRLEGGKGAAIGAIERLNLPAAPVRRLARNTRDRSEEANERPRHLATY